MALQFLPLLASAAISASSPSPSHLQIKRCEFDEAYQFGATSCSLQLSNSGDKPITIQSAIAAVPGDSVAGIPLVVPPHATVYAQARVNWNNELGHAIRLFRLVTDEAGQEKRNAEITGFVGSALEDGKPKLDFGVVNVPGEPVEKTVALSSREVSDFRIVKILAAPAYIDARIGADGKTVVARTRSELPWGLQEDGKIRVEINTPNQREAWVAVRIDVHGEVVPDANPLSLGLMRKGNKNEFLVRLTSRDGKDFEVGKVHAERLRGNASVESCVPAQAGCRLVRFHVAEDQPTGAIGDSIRIELPGLQRELPVVVWGMLVGPHTQVRDLGEEMQKAAEAQAKRGVALDSPAAPRKGVDLKEALRANVEKETPVPPPAGNGPLLKWSVLHESAIHGYAIYRADSESGPFVRINKDTIATTAVGEGGASYQWRDNTATSGKTYWYYVGLLNKDGSKGNLTPPQKAVAK
ncbi:hypothetical protein [Dokdonella sp.]|uniref:hypothetical protein n=1 Tax=Dokdonella sp. TaxID=2291710 RepID=UPI0037844FFE